MSVVIEMNKVNLARELRERCVGRVLEDEPLSRHTTFGVGGPADLFFYPASAEDLAIGLPILRDADVPTLMIGGGTNMLVKDAGFRGVAIGLTEGATQIRFDSSYGYVEAGAQTQVFSRRCQREGMAGFEFGCGIPGTIGGAVRGNAGAWGGETFDRLVDVTVVNPSTGEARLITKNEIVHSYRYVAMEPDTIILEARFALDEDDPDSIQRRMDRMLSERKASQPLDMRNAGCVFKNHEGTSAGMLIDRAGCKGLAVGNVEVSKVHANFLVTKGGITAAEVLKLIDQVRDRVSASQGVDLETEVRIIGEHGIENV